MRRALEPVDLTVPLTKRVKSGTLKAAVLAQTTLLDGGSNGTCRVMCKHCGVEFTAGTSRLAAHLTKTTGKGIAVCPEVPDSVREEILALQNADSGPGNSTKVSSDPPTSQPSIFKSSQASTKTGGQRDGDIRSLFDRTGKHAVDMAVAAFFLGLGIPFDNVNHPLFKEMCFAISKFQHEYHACSSYQLRTTLMRDTRKEIDEKLKVILTHCYFQFCYLM